MSPSLGSVESGLIFLIATLWFSILYQRGIYPPDDFKMVKKYGLTLFTSADEALESYIQQVMKKSQGKLD